MHKHVPIKFTFDLLMLFKICKNRLKKQKNILKILKVFTDKIVDKN